VPVVLVGSVVVAAAVASPPLEDPLTLDVGSVGAVAAAPLTLLVVGVGAAVPSLIFSPFAESVS
jgi:hypothetical protein